MNPLPWILLVLLSGCCTVEHEITVKETAPYQTGPSVTYTITFKQ